jgi:hypothetical protein
VKILFFLAAACISFTCSALPPQCDVNNFPDFWADAQDRVAALNSALNSAEAEHPYSKASAKAFHQSLSVCASKRKSIWNESTASGSGGVSSQMKCEASLICSRLQVLETGF